ncbi:MAG TPA: alkaline phosphatase D family protein [Vicinamibacterales bacterium]|nr:alkaline phosphatase D family protein [Vicinamibacterales bacterium]
MTNPARVYDRTLARLSRRQLLDVAWKLGAAALVPPALPSRLFAQPGYRTYPFTLGVASGDPLPDGVVLWTRLAPEPLDGGGMPMANVEVGWEVASDRLFRSVVQKGTAIARPELGHSVHVELQGLEAGREYWYRFRSGGEVSQTGRTRTAPGEGAAVDRLRFAVCGCNHFETGYFTAFRRIAAEQFDFVFHTGDYIYEGRADGGRSAAAVRQHRGQEIYTLVDYRNRYAQYKSDPDLRAAHASAPFIVTWDDHEVDNDYAGDVDENDTPPEVFLLRRAAAYQAFYEAMPLRAANLPSGPHLRLHRRLRFGGLLDLTVLDTRQYRSDQVCGGGSATGCAAALEAGRTMLGAEQERWLFEQLGGVRATWTVLGQQVPTFARDLASFNPDGRFSMDKWDGYVAARKRLYDRLVETKAPNPIVLSGDVHVHYGAELKLDFEDPRSATVAVEFTNTSITSGGDGADVSANWEPIRTGNPHIKYHSARRGYIACTATPATMRADFRILDRVSTPDSPDRIGGSLIVEAGRPGTSLS